MKTVKRLLLELSQTIDPRTESQVLFTEDTVGVTNGDKFTAIRLIDIYSTARTALTRAVMAGADIDQVTALLSGMVETASVVWTLSAGGNGIQYTKPSGFMAAVKFYSITGVPNNVVILPVSLKAQVLAATNTHFLQNATTRAYIFEEGPLFKHYGGIIASANTNIRLTYVKCDSLTAVNLADTETVDERHYPILLELAQAVAQEMGSIDLNALAMKLIGKGK